MNLLLDTHVWIWWYLDPDRLPRGVVELITRADSEVFLSTASVWEMAVKMTLGKLRLPKALDEMVAESLREDGFRALPVLNQHAYGVLTLPFIHRDPFDRLLVAQARSEGLKLVSLDPTLSDYDVDVIRE